MFLCLWCYTVQLNETQIQGFSPRSLHWGSALCQQSSWSPHHFSLLLQKTASLHRALHSTADGVGEVQNNGFFMCVRQLLQQQTVRSTGLSHCWFEVSALCKYSVFLVKNSKSHGNTVRTAQRMDNNN